MSLVRVHNFAVSLDGFATGEGQSFEQPFGHAGSRLLERWKSDSMSRRSAPPAASRTSRSPAGRSSCEGMWHDGA